MMAEQYICRFCFKKFYKEDELDLHMFTHMGDSVDCRQCIQLIQRRYELILSLLIHIRGQQHECKECNHLSYEEQQISCLKWAHMNEALHEGDRTMKVISEGEESSQAVVKIKVDDGKMESSLCNDLGKYECKECSEIFLKREHLQSHMFIHTKEKKPKVILPCKSQLKNYEKVKRDKTKYKCKTCNKGFAKEEKLNKHILVHTWMTETVNKSSMESQNEFQQKAENIDEIDENQICSRIYIKDEDFLGEDLDTPHVIEVSEDILEAELKNIQVGSLAHMEAGIANLVPEKQNSYECGECNQNFAEADDLIQHMLLHTEAKPSHMSIINELISQVNEEVPTVKLKSENVVKAVEAVKSCKDCGMMVADMKFHVCLNKEQNSFVCSVCGQDFPRKCSLMIHMNIHSKEKNFKCEECGKAFNHKVHLETHMNIHNNSAQHNCKKCGEVFMNSGDFKKHLRIHWKEADRKTYHCEHCGKLFIRKKALVSHTMKHSVDTNLKCGECGKWFVTKRSLIDHAHVHTGIKNYQCEECGKLISTKTNLKLHMLRHKGEKNFTCSVCGRSFFGKSGLDAHYLTHTGEKNHQCEECGHSFSLKPNLCRHMAIHRGEKKFQCDECGKLFRQKGGLKIHMQRMHTEKNEIGTFDCQICNRKYFSKKSLSNHMVIHSGGKNYVCNECGKRFVSNAGLEMHLRIHTGVKTFECHLCNKKFAYRQSLEYHMISHSDLKNFECKECGKMFKYHSTLSRHMQLTSHCSTVVRNVIDIGNDIIIKW